MWPVTKKPRYTDRGVSNAAVSAGRAEPIDERDPENISDHLL
jgi:hypothetical protein